MSYDASAPWNTCSNKRQWLACETWGPKSYIFVDRIGKHGNCNACSICQLAWPVNQTWDYGCGGGGKKDGRKRNRWNKQADWGKNSTVDPAPVMPDGMDELFEKCPQLRSLTQDPMQALFYMAKAVMGGGIDCWQEPNKACGAGLIEQVSSEISKAPGAKGIVETPKPVA